MNIVCPIPSPSASIITLGHGSGGSLTHRLLQEYVFEALGNSLLSGQHDGAFLDLDGPVAFSTDSYVVSPLFFPGGDIGDLAVNGTVNDLAMCGARARYLSLSFILEEGFPLEDFRRILQSIRRSAARAGVDVVTGDTKVVEKGKGDGVFINTSGLGNILPGACIHHNRIRPGDALIVSGPLAAHGIAIMSLREGLQFETSVCSDTRPLNESIAALIGAFGEKIKFLRDPTRGGVASVLNEVAAISGMGFRLVQASLPLDAEVEGACEMLGLDPLYVANEGIFLAVVSPDITAAFVESLRRLPGGEGAAVIGEVTTENAVVLQSRIGGRRLVNSLAGEQLPRIC